MTKKSSNPAGGVAPYGYKWESGTLVVDRVEAPIRKLIYELFLKHRRKKTVAKILNDLGHRTRRGSVFYDTTILRLIADSTAKGEWRTEDSITAVEPIVSKDTWDRANAILAGGGAAKQSSQLFHGVVYCQCGDRMTVASGSPNYSCSSCRRKIPILDLEEVFISQLATAEPSDRQLTLIQDLWPAIGHRDKRILIEQICSRIVVGQATIDIELAIGDAEGSFPAEVSQERNECLYDDSEMNNLSDQPLLSELEAARFLDISKSTLMRRRKAGQVNFFRLGPLVKYSRGKHLLPYLRSLENRDD